MSAIANTPRSRFSESANARRSASQARLMRRSSKGDMNVTPFIDVLLVLLIMLIMAVPIKVHETTVDLPRPCLDCGVNADINTVAITADDQLLWNATPVTPDQLRIQVEQASMQVPEAQLRFEPAANASYDRSASTIALMKEAGAKSFGFVGNAQYREFGR